MQLLGSCVVWLQKLFKPIGIVVDVQPQVIHPYVHMHLIRRMNIRFNQMVNLTAIISLEHEERKNGQGNGQKDQDQNETCQKIGRLVTFFCVAVCYRFNLILKILLLEKFLHLFGWWFRFLFSFFHLRFSWN